MEGQRIYTLKWFEVYVKMYRNSKDRILPSCLNCCETVRMHPIKTTHIPVVDYTYNMILRAV